MAEDDLESDVIVWGAVCHTVTPSSSLHLLSSYFQMKAVLWLWTYLFLQEDSAHWLLAPKSLFFLTSVLWAAPPDSLMEGPVVWHPDDLSPSHPMERAWDSHTCFVSSPLYRTHHIWEKPQNPGVWACACCSFLGQLKTSAGKPNSRHWVFTVPRLIMFFIVRVQP